MTLWLSSGWNAVPFCSNGRIRTKGLEIGYIPQSVPSKPYPHHTKWYSQPSKPGMSKDAVHVTANLNARFSGLVKFNGIGWWKSGRNTHCSTPLSPLFRQRLVYCLNRACFQYIWMMKQGAEICPGVWPKLSLMMVIGTVLSPALLSGIKT